MDSKEQGEPKPVPGEAPITRDELARSAGVASLARAASIIEILSQPLATWLFGLATYGVYVVLWGAINLVSNIADLGMTIALSRVVPSATSEESAHGGVKFALLVAVLPTSLLALIATLNADALAGLVSSAPEDRASLPAAIAIFAWALPLWTFIEVATAAARARRAFGPEIRLRLFWEQVARIIFALGFFLVGFRSTGLVLAHLCSLTVTAALCVRLLGRYFDLSLLVRAPLSPRIAANLLLSGLALLPSALSRRLLIDAPPLLLNMMLPGARGATAAALFEIARKISTVPNLIQQAVQYVIGPMSAAQSRIDHNAVALLYHFACRLSAALILPLAGLLIFAGADILKIYRPEAAAALPLLQALVVGRGLVAIAGPATVVVEMTGHRGLPLLNSLIGTVLGGILAFLLVPGLGPLGMAIAAGAATVLSAYAAAFELRIGDGFTTFDRTLVAGIAVALAGSALMGLAELLDNSAARLAVVIPLWGATTWCALRIGMSHSDRLALGAFARRTRLV